MTPSFPWLDDQPLAGLLAVLDGDGEEARVVGGAVRNALLGEAVTDFDIATTALPVEVTARCHRAGWKVVPTGIDHGTVTVVADGRQFEVTTLREDVATDGRHAVVRFGRNFAADAERRDFTINALSVSPDGRLHDHVGGLADLEARRVRFIGDADRRIAEDYLRILRLLRFHARYGAGPIDREAFAAAIRGRAGLARLSRERIHAELMKLLLAPGVVPVIGEADGAGLLLAALGGVVRVPALARLIEAELALGLEPDPIRRLGALALFVAEDADRLARLLRLSKAQVKRLSTMAGEAVRSAPGPAGARSLAYRLGQDGARDALLVAAAQAGGEPWRVELDTIARWEIPAMPFTGEEAARIGVSPGPAMGRLLSEAERLWIAADFPADAEARTRLLQDARMRVAPIG